MGLLEQLFGRDYLAYQRASRMTGPRSLARSTAKAPTSPGVYLLSRDREHVQYVGRAGNLRARLRRHEDNGDYAFFRYCTTHTENGAFFKECREYHRYGKRNHLDNEIHPARPAGSRLPACGQNGCRGEP